MLRTRPLPAGHSSLALAAALLVCTALPAQAQMQEQPEPQASGNASGHTLPTVTVQARRSAEQARDLPFTVQAVGEAELQERRLNNLEDLLRATPGVEVNTWGGADRANVRMRGVGSLYPSGEDDTSVIMNVDGVSTSVSNAALGMLDVEQVEVPKGPQGTLFGRNRAAGVVNIRTRRPTLGCTEGHARAEAGSGHQHLAEGALNLPLGSFVSMTAIAKLIETGLEHIHTLLAVPPLPQATPAQTPIAFDIDFEGIRFAYAPGTPPVLENFCARLPARSMTALVGPSGGGKTTITRLLMRHADPQAGCVRIGGVDVRHIPPEALGQLVSVVFQDVYLFDDTVLANICMARPEASEEQVRQAARNAQCLEFIERLPQGWHTRIGEIGASLSGGERQRLSIARALLKDAPIVVLDEPTAALDTESELAVQRAIEALVRDRTVIVIAHRLSTIAGAGQILVIDQGRALEAGTHAGLLARNGRYAALWRAQQSAKQWRA